MTDTWFCSPCMLHSCVLLRGCPCRPSSAPRAVPATPRSVAPPCSRYRAFHTWRMCLSPHVTSCAPSTVISPDPCAVPILWFMYILMIWQMIWTQQNIQPRLEEHRQTQPRWFSQLSTQDFIWGPDPPPASLILFNASFLALSLPILRAEPPSFQAVPFASLPSWLLIPSVPENSIFFFLLSLFNFSPSRLNSLMRLIYSHYKILTSWSVAYRHAPSSFLYII